MTHHVLLAVSLLTVLCSPSVLLAQDAEQAAREAAFSELMSGLMDSHSIFHIPM